MRREMAEEWSFVGEVHAGNSVAILPDFQDYVYYVIDVTLRVDAAGNRETN